MHLQCAHVRSLTCQSTKRPICSWTNLFIVEIGLFFPVSRVQCSQGRRNREGERNIITRRFISLDAPRVLREQNKLDRKQFSFLILCDNENTTSQIGNGIELVFLPLSPFSPFLLPAVCACVCGNVSRTSMYSSRSIDM
jgi:hypothetical protein